MRWQHPMLVSDASFDATWGRQRDDAILFVGGAGFDPRATIVFERLVRATTRRIDVVLVTLSEEATDLAVRPRALANRKRLTEMVEQRGGTLYEQALPAFNDGRALGRLISRTFQSQNYLDSYSEVLVEISAMPRSIFFPLVRGILERAHAATDDPMHWDGDLHVAVCESPETDGSILEEGVTPMSTIGGFNRTRTEEPATTIWVPVLGEGAIARVEQIYKELEPDEVCPVLPWPARDPRRGDSLMNAYRQLLFETIRIEPRNVIHAAERNPFDLYRSVGALNARYCESLRPLGTVSMVLSSHSSKLLSVGVLLAAYDYGLEVQHVSPGTYGLHDTADDSRAHDEIFDLWLTGEPYR